MSRYHRKTQFVDDNSVCYFGCARTTNLDMTFDIAPFVFANKKCIFVNMFI